MITDARHLDRVVRDLILYASRLTNAWMDEDAAACSPRSTGDGPGGTGPGDPTPSIAGTDWKFRHRDDIGRLLIHVTKKLGEEVEALTPRKPHEKCTCCHTEMATHGRSCWACKMYLKKMGHRCDDDIHDGRPKVRMCECPIWCCDICPDRVGESRTRLSDRCAKRVSRASRSVS